MTQDEYREAIKSHAAALPFIRQCYHCTGELSEGAFHDRCKRGYLDRRMAEFEQREWIRQHREKFGD